MLSEPSVVVRLVAAQPADGAHSSAEGTQDDGRYASGVDDLPDHLDGLVEAHRSALRPVVKFLRSSAALTTLEVATIAAALSG